jgi:hypothetical protein
VLLLTILKRFVKTNEQTTDNRKFRAFWVIAPCCLGVDRHFKICTASIITLMMEETTRRFNPKGSNLHTRRHEKLKSQTVSRLSCVYVLTPWRQNSKVDHRTHNSPLPVPILSQSNPIHTPQPVSLRSILIPRVSVQSTYLNPL